MRNFVFSLLAATSLLIAVGASSPELNSLAPRTEISAVNSLLPIQQELETCNEDTLVLLDIGGTLLIRKDPILHNSHENWKRMWFERHHPEMTREEKLSLIRIVEESGNSWQLVDAWPELIRLAQSKKAKVVAFTKVVIDPSLHNFRGTRLLERFGLPFQDDLPELHERDTQFVYESGVIQTNARFKGDTLKQVLKKLNKVPQKIVFVDDRKEQLESVQKACNEVGIPVVCFHYTAFDKSPPLDEAVANLQLEILVKERRWMTTAEVTSSPRAGPKL